MSNAIKMQTITVLVHFLEMIAPGEVTLVYKAIIGGDETSKVTLRYRLQYDEKSVANLLDSIEKGVSAAA